MEKTEIRSLQKHFKFAAAGEWVTETVKAWYVVCTPPPFP